MKQGLPGGCNLKRLTIRGDERGSLIAIEESADVPFRIARIYYVYATRPGVVRGQHAHRILRQGAVAISGACTMDLDDGERRASVRLDDPALMLLMPPMVWHDMRDFTADCVLLVLAEAPYDEADYVRDYDRFVELVRAYAQ